jgi:hypothetical protein
MLGLAHAQSAPRSAVAGVVSERASGEVIIGATVILHRDSTAPRTTSVRGAITNKFGFYSIANVEPGAYYLTVSAVGYHATTHAITVTAEGKSLRLDVQVETEDIRKQEVVIQADRDQTKGTSVSTVELRPEFIQQLPAFGGEVDIFRALQLLPGVKAVSEISSGLYVRGGSPDQNLTLLDGVIVYNPSHLGGFLSTFNSDAVRDIKLSKGAFPAEYGGRLSSVLDMTMREGTKEKISGTAGVSLINSRLTLEGPIGQDATFMVSGRRMYLDLILLAATDPEEVPTYYFYDLNGKVNYRLSESDRIYLSGYFGRDVFGGPPEENDLFDISWGNSTANLRWSHIVSATLFTNFSAIYTDYHFGSLIEDRSSQGVVRSGFKSISGIRDYMLRGEAQWFPNEEHTVKFGVEGTQHRFRADASAEITDFARIDATPTILTSIDASVYLQDDWKITPQLSGNFGARLYYFQNGNYLRAEPRLSLAYNLTEDVTLKSAFAVGNQFLHLVTRNDIGLPTDVWFPSTSTVKPSEALQGVLGLETNLFDHQYLFTIEGYYKSMRNLLEYKDTASFSIDVPLESSFTSGTGDAYGVELFLNKRVGSFTGWIGYTLAWTRRHFDELNNGQSFYPRYDRRHDISVVLTYRLGESWELGATWVYGTGQAYTTATGQYYLPDIDSDPTGITRGDYGSRRLSYTERNGYRLPAFHKLDLNFTHKFSWFDLPWQFSINIYNAYNRKNVFAQFLEPDGSGEVNPATGEYETKYKIKRITLFPIIPTFGLSCKF